MIGEQLKHFARVIPPKAGFELRERVALPGNRRFRRFLIVTPGRAGSQMLVQRCNSHQQVTCYGELFATEHINWQTCGRLEADRRALATRNRDPLRFLARHVWHAQPAWIRALGFKLTYAQLLHTRAVLEPLIKVQPDLRIIWLERRNKFEMCLSHLISHATNLYRLEIYDEARNLAPVTIDVEALERAIKLLEVAQHNIMQILDGSVCLPLLYEDLVAQPDRSNRTICEFLGVDDRPLTHTSKKQARGSLAERVTNFEELREHCEGTRWEHCLTDA